MNRLALALVALALSLPAFPLETMRRHGPGSAPGV
jgi:hypothetical protein